MDTAAGEGVEVGGQNGNQGFAFAGLHFSNATLVQNDAAHQLHGEGAHSQHPVGSLPDGSKCLGEQTIQGFTLVQAVFQLLGFGFQCFLGKRLVCFFHAQNFIYHGLNFLNFPLRAGAEYFCNQTHFSLLLRWYYLREYIFEILYHRYRKKYSMKFEFFTATPQGNDAAGGCDPPLGWPV